MSPVGSPPSASSSLLLSSWMSIPTAVVAIFPGFLPLFTFDNDHMSESNLKIPEQKLEKQSKKAKNHQDGIRKKKKLDHLRYP